MQGERAERKRLTKALKAKTEELKAKVKEAALPVKQRVKKHLERRLNEAIEDKLEVEEQLDEVEAEHAKLKQEKR